MTAFGRDQAATAGAPDLSPTDDAFLGGRLGILQPRKGYRAGLDAVLLASAAALPQDDSTDVLDCGAGVGTAGLCLAFRCHKARVTLVEREPELLDLARQNISRNGLDGRVAALAGDLTAPAQSPAAPVLPPESFDLILVNPPYHTAAHGTPARHQLKSNAHAMDEGDLTLWARFAARMARPGGHLLLIQKAGALPRILEAFGNRFGGIAVTPIHPYQNAPANRVLIEATKGSRAEFSLRPALILHGADGAFTPYLSRILRDGCGLQECVLPESSP